MHLLDTDTLSRLHAGDVRVQRHRDRFDPAEVATTIITRIEIVRGRFDFVLKAADSAQMRLAQGWLQHSEELLGRIPIVVFDDSALAEFDKLRQDKKLKKIGRADLLIACIALANRATLVTRNVKHFSQVSGLRIENWLD